MISSDVINEIELIKNAPQKIKEAIEKEGEIASYGLNEIVIPAGQPVTFLGIILDGTVEAMTPDLIETPHAFEGRKKGDYFGEVSLMTGEPAAFSIVCTSSCRVLMVPAHIFQQWLVTDIRAINIFSRTLATRTNKLDYHIRKQEELVEKQTKQKDPYGLNLITQTPMKILVINLGSSSLKYHYFDTQNQRNNAQGLIEPIGGKQVSHKYKTEKGEYTFELGTVSYEQAIKVALDQLCDKHLGVLSDLRDLTAIGHRVVHGGEKYLSSTIIDDKVLQGIKDLAPLAPLHNPIHVIGIESCKKIIPHVQQVAVFDTAFHYTLPPRAYLYGIPKTDIEGNLVRRYGAHGPSHKYVAMLAATAIKRPFAKAKIITCHLGNGSSICAIDHGRSIDTSMGFTPLEGLIMGSRCGDIDPAVVMLLQESQSMNSKEMLDFLNRQCGLKGLSGISTDVRELIEAANEGNHDASIALQTFSYRIRKYIGAYFVALGGLDALVFTGGIGENAVGIRAMACQSLWHMNILLDEVRNRNADLKNQPIAEISHPNSQVKIFVVHTDEARMIACETIRLLGYQGVAKGIGEKNIRIPILISAHHVHLSHEDCINLFGPGYQLTPKNPLGQPGQFACEEQISLIGPRGKIDRVRILGPLRSKSQVEISRTDEFRLGINAPIRMSGDLHGSPGVILEGPAGQVKLQEGVILAQRHIHIPPQEASSFGLMDNDLVKIRVEGDRELIFGDVIVRVHPDFILEMHVDTDEGNAAQLNNNSKAYLEEIQHRNNPLNPPDMENDNSDQESDEQSKKKELVSVIDT